MELRLLQTFVAVAELRHFARAADRCHLSQPAVSHQIRQLESDLDTKLLNRDGRRVSLTVAGESLLDDARRIIAAVDRARERVRNVATGAVGRVRIGATSTEGLYRLPAALERFRREHPRFDLVFTIGSESDLLSRVAANELDMAVVAGRPPLGELQARAIATDDLCIVGPPHPGRGKRRKVSAVDLRSETWIQREEGSDTRRQLDAWLRRHRVVPARTLTLNGPDAVKRAIAAGLGVGLVSGIAAREELGAGTLSLIRLDAAVLPRKVLLVDHPHKHHGAACSAMIRMLEAG